MIFEEVPFERLASRVPLTMVFLMMEPSAVDRSTETTRGAEEGVENVMETVEVFPLNLVKVILRVTELVIVF